MVEREGEKWEGSIKTIIHQRWKPPMDDWAMFFAWLIDGLCRNFELVI